MIMQGYKFNKISGWYDSVLDFYDSHVAGENPLHTSVRSAVKPVLDIYDERLEAKKNLGISQGEFFRDEAVRKMQGEPSRSGAERFLDSYAHGADIELTGKDREIRDAIIQQGVKANYGWNKNPVTGKYDQDRSEDVMTEHRKRLEAEEGSGSSGMGSLAEKGLRFAGLIPNKTIMKNVEESVRRGAEGAVKQNAVYRPGTGVPYAVSEWLRTKGYPNLAEYAKSPGLFWGAIGAGVIGIPMLVSLFLNRGNNSKNPNITVNINTQGQGVPTTTSYYRYRP